MKFKNMLRITQFHLTIITKQLVKSDQLYELLCTHLSQLRKYANICNLYLL